MTLFEFFDLERFATTRLPVTRQTLTEISRYVTSLPAGTKLYLMAPLVIDAPGPHGDLIPIEQRAATEVTHSNGKQMTPHGVAIENPAFDVTPAELIAGIITEKGIIHPVNTQTIAATLTLN